MALNFPPINAEDSDPTNGMIWTAPNGHQWIYDESVPGWKSIAPTGNSNIVYRGGIDLTDDPNDQFTNIVSGNQFAVTVGGDPVSDAPNRYPGLGGQTVVAGAVVMYDGNEWQALNNIPYATQTTPGIVELADADEARDGESVLVAMTPKRVVQSINTEVPQASTTEVGRTRYATVTEAYRGDEKEAALTPNSIKNILDDVRNAVDNLVPVGMIAWFPARANKDIPAGWMKCNGDRIYNNGETKRLFQALTDWDNPWGNGSVVRVPDLRGRFIRGYAADSGRDPDNAAFGESQSDSFKSHDHSIDDPGHSHTVKGFRVNEGDDNDGNERVIVDDDFDPGKRHDDNGAALKTITNIKKTEDKGGKETRPKNLNLTPVIKL